MSAAPDYAAIVAGLREKLRKALLSGAPTADLHRQIETAEERLEEAAKATQRAEASRAAAEQQAHAQRLETLGNAVSVESHARLRALLGKLAPPAGITPKRG